MKRNLITAIAIMALCLTANAQQQNGGRRQQMDPTEVYNRMAERYVKQMKLDDDKAEVFKVLYLDYQTARHNATHPKGGESSDEQAERVDFKKLTDEQAKELIEKQFKGQEAQLQIDKEYLPKFLEILTPAQAAQIYVRQGGNRNGQGQGRPYGGQGRQGGFGGPGGGFGGQGGFGGGF